MPPEAHKGEKNCKLFIGGITFNTTDEILQEFYSQWGTLTDWKAMRDQTGRPRGFGFVTYEDPACLEAAMAARPHVIDGKTVDPKRAIPREMNQEASAGSVKRVYVGGCRHLDQDALLDYFGAFGTVEQVEIPLNKETGEPRGFAFVTFDDYDAVDKCVLQGPTHNIGGGGVTVKKAQEKGSGGTRGGMVGGGGVPGGRDRGGARMGRPRAPTERAGPYSRGGFAGGGYGQGGWRGGYGGYGGGGAGYGDGFYAAYPPPYAAFGASYAGGWTPDGGWHNGYPYTPIPPHHGSGNGGGGSWTGSKAEVKSE